MKGFVGRIVITIMSFKSWFTKSLTRKLILGFSLLVTLLIFTLSYISYSKIADITKEDFIYNNENILKLMNQNFENYMTQIKELSLNFMKDSQFMDDLLDQKDNYVAETYIQNQIKNLFLSKSNIEELKFYIPENAKEYKISRTNKQLEISYKGDIVKEDWYKKLQNENFYNRFIEPLKDYTHNLQSREGNTGIFFTYHRLLINIQDKKQLGIISISPSLNDTQKLFGNSVEKSGEMLAVYDNKLKPFFYDNKKLVQFYNDKDFVNKLAKISSNGSFTTRLANEDYLAIYSVSEQDSWKIIKLIPLKVLNLSAKSTRSLSLLIGAIFFVMFIIITVLISNAITGPLRGISRKMEVIGDGNFKVISEVKGNDEISKLTKKFNTMVVRIEELINEEYKIKLSERNARLKALEAQINPHFLYNSLQAISTEALEHNMSKISSMVQALAFTLRYCFKEGDVVEISKEIEHIKNYLFLQNARFEDRLLVRLEIDDDVLATVLPKLSIQTIVENSIKHGLERISIPITIIIRAYKEANNVIIRVFDNGPGIHKERLEEINKELNDSRWIKEYENSIGLKNLFVRLNLMFNGKASLEVISEDGQGTEVKISLPQMAQEE